jgi:colanic acid biosynthesis glycosyl transferase WcaI
MRILVLGINYWPELTGIAPFTTGRCEYLAARGHEVIVCTSMPYYPEWRIAPNYKKYFLLREKHNEVTILRCRSYVPKRANSFRRVLHEGSFVAGSLLCAFTRKKPDVMLVVSPPLGLGLAAVLLSRRWGIPFVFHVPDLQPDAAVDLGMLPAGALVRALYALEGFTYRNAALISTLTEAMRQQIISKGIVPGKVKLLADWAAADAFSVPLEGGGSNFRAAYKLDDRLLVLHCGNMGIKQGLEVVLGAAELSRNDSRIEYLLVGDGAVRTCLQQEAAARKISNVNFMPLQPPAQFIELLAASDVALITQRRTVANVVFPSKTLTLMAAGRPVIASVNRQSEVAGIVMEAGAGLVVEPENPSALHGAIKILMNDPLRRHRMGARAKAFARRHWDRDRSLAVTEAELESVVEPWLGSERASAREKLKSAAEEGGV